MPGLFGLSNIQKNIKSYEELLKVLTHEEDRFITKSYDNDVLFHGLADFDFNVKYNFFSNDKISCMVFGDVHEFKSTTIKEENKAKFLINKYEQHGAKFIKYLNGSYAISIIDKDKMYIFSDRLGSKQIFYNINNGNLIFSSEIKTLLEGGNIDPEWNMDSLSEFFTFAYPIGAKTFFKCIKVLPPSTYILYENEKIKMTQYWDIKFHNSINNDLTPLYNEFGNILSKSVKNKIENKRRVGIFLSGGLDSRIIAGAANKISKKNNIELMSFTFGTKGGWQEKIASEIAKNLGIKNFFYEIPSDFISNYAEEIVYKGDGHIRIRDSHFMSLLDNVSKKVDHVLLGFFCSELFGELIPEDVEKSKNIDDMLRKMLAINIKEQTAGPLNKIFKDGKKNGLYQNAKKSFVNVVKNYDLENYEQYSDYYIVREMARKNIMPLANYINWYLEPLLPFIDNDMVDFALKLPLELRKNKLFIHKAIWHLYPTLAEIPYERSGVPPNTKGLSLLISRGKRFSDRKVKGTIQKISSGKIRFRPKKYRAYEYWLREDSREYTESILKNLKMQRLNQKYIDTLLDEHMSCSENHDQLICDLLNIELLYRNYL